MLAIRPPASVAASLSRPFRGGVSSKLRLNPVALCHHRFKSRSTFLTSFLGEQHVEPKTPPRKVESPLRNDTDTPVVDCQIEDKPDQSFPGAQSVEDTTHFREMHPFGNNAHGASSQMNFGLNPNAEPWRPYQDRWRVTEGHHGGAGETGGVIAEDKKQKQDQARLSDASLAKKVRADERKARKKAKKAASREAAAVQAAEKKHIPEPPAHKSRRAAPIPKKAYLDQAAGKPQPIRQRQPLLIVLDLNGTLIHRYRKGVPLRFVSRPGLDEFLDRLLKEYRVLVWSSARPLNVKGICDTVFSKAQREQLLGEWGRDELALAPELYNANVQVYKTLDTVWENQPIQWSYRPFPIRRRREHEEEDDNDSGDANTQAAKADAGAATEDAVQAFMKSGKLADQIKICWDQTNTILLDDSKLKATSEPYNVIEIPTFTRNTRPDADERNILTKVLDLLEILSSHEDVSTVLHKWDMTVANNPKMSSIFDIGNEALEEAQQPDPTANVPSLIRRVHNLRPEEKASLPALNREQNAKNGKRKRKAARRAAEEAAKAAKAASASEGTRTPATATSTTHGAPAVAVASASASASPHLPTSPAGGASLLLPERNKQEHEQEHTTTTTSNTDTPTNRPSSPASSVQSENFLLDELEKSLYN
ncbi:HAD-like protein [Aspergillus heteromorphus CBS 117.55]|uniref:HAD-like protein n=1 Tax=Aspergillus heteromorphus CBS 117.55 TaxID=1448321 RepID=A0A317WFH5_9EURO|nr:HAD-like protein [Aspergillus heteromorphus CBS 117.55]PWY83000.1 HAD-like protein [Aspergillus heteromorphus CBS 117.55]